VHEKPRMLQIFHIGGGRQQMEHAFFKCVEQGIDQQLFAGKVVEKIAWADAHVRCNQRGRDIGFAETVEQTQGRGQNALGGTARRFFHPSAFGSGVAHAVFERLEFGFECTHAVLQLRHVLRIWQTQLVQCLGHTFFKNTL
jgi:hypothetical protein